MKRNREMEEYLETLWCLREDEGNGTSEIFLGRLVKEHDPESLRELEKLGYISIDGENSAIHFTSEGEEFTRKLIRAHRIGERLIHDVLGGEFESGACEFEHIVHTELVDAICTLLGHPEECPHGYPIPRGECCRKSLQTVRSPVIPVKDLDVGQNARIAYVLGHDDRQMHVIDGLQIRPGTFVKMHQKRPVYVIECEGVVIAVDEEIASNIRVWSDTRSRGEEESARSDYPSGQGRRKRRFRFRRGSRPDSRQR